MKKKRLKSNINGLLLIDKPLGFSSNQALSKIKWLFTPIKAGHTGTLDPMATGLLPICLGEATKFSSYLLDSDKTYEGVIKLGFKSDTGDSEGNIIKQKNISLPELAVVEKTLKDFIGKIYQVPPMHSALKFKGKALYKYARDGLEVERKKRIIEVYKLSVIDYKKGLLKLDIKCSKGTYIRVLAEDIGNSLGVGGYLTGLRRIEIGSFKLVDSITIDSIEKTDCSERIKFLKPIKDLLEDLNPINLSEREEILIKNGQRLIMKNLIPGDYSLFDMRDNFLGVGSLTLDNVLQVKRLISTQDK